MFQLLMEIQCKGPGQRLYKTAEASTEDVGCSAPAVRPCSISLGSATCASEAPPHNTEQGGMLGCFEGHCLPTTSSF